VPPQSCQDLLEVVADVGRPLRAAQIATAAGLSTDQARMEGLWSRCAGRGRPGQPLLCPPNCFVHAGGDRRPAPS
jgi:hypothetical protein